MVAISQSGFSFSHPRCVKLTTKISHRFYFMNEDAEAASGASSLGEAAQLVK